MVDPGADTDYDLIALDFSAIGDHSGHCLGAVCPLEAGDFEAGYDAHALGFGLLGKSVNRRRVVGVATLFLMENGGDTLRLPVREHTPHVCVRGVLAFDKTRRITDGLLL